MGHNQLMANRRIDCPLPEYQGAFIELPERWLGAHAQRRDTAVETAEAHQLGMTLTNFAVSMAILEDWSLPGLAGNPARWDFKQIDLRLIAWVNEQTLTDFAACFIVPKNSWPPSPSGAAAAEAAANVPGDSEVT
jgi:hypothetical protein